MTSFSAEKRERRKAGKKEGRKEGKKEKGGKKEMGKERKKVNAEKICILHLTMKGTPPKYKFG